MKNKQGFTLAELLVVVAIIAVLVAVSIPIFTSKIDAARTATDDANIRAAKAAAIAEYSSDDTNIKLDSSGKYTNYTCYYDADNGIATLSKKSIKGYNKQPVKLIYAVGTPTAERDSAIIRIDLLDDPEYGIDPRVYWIEESK